ncbi:MAG: glycosyltransferase [Isosphaeraceae bacterium]|nr:glycosyltransferase [Isosphaeraceae bacterium]
MGSLTVAVPTYNGARHLAEALRSIMAQEGPPFDLLLCDDRSDDDTLAVARAEAGDRLRIEVNPERLGLAGNWNRCIELARTDWVAVFHQDDVMRPGHLAAQRAAIAAQDGLGLVCVAAEVIDAEGRPVPASVVARGDLGPGDRVFPPGAFVAELAVSNPVRCSAVVIRKAAWADVGSFDPSYRYVVDWDFWLRVARRWSVAWLARPTVAIRWHPASETHRFKTGTADLDEQARLLEGLYATDGPRLPEARRLRRAAERRLARAYLNRAYDAAKGGDSSLSRRCLRRALALGPGLLGMIARDPRLALRLAAVLLAPGLVDRRAGHVETVRSRNL